MDMPQTAVKGIVVVVFGLILVFVATGLCDYIYIRHIVGQFESGLSNVDFANPHLGKALVSAMASIVTLVYLRTSALTPGFIVRLFHMGSAGGLLLAGAHLVAGVSTSGHYFDALGKALLHYEITYDNHVVFFSSHTISPYTGKPLKLATPEVIHNLEMRRKRGNFAEVNSPEPKEWWAPGTAEPLLWYSKREDGVHLFNMDGYDPATKGELAPVTPEIQRLYYEQKRAEEQKRKRTAEQAAKRKLAEEQAFTQELLKKQEPPNVSGVKTAPVAVGATASRGPNWFQRNISPVVEAFVPKVTLNVIPAAPSIPVQSVPIHSLCGTRHFRNELCPATGRANTP